jgi:hypothetical protein
MPNRNASAELPQGSPAVISDRSVIGVHCVPPDTRDEAAGTASIVEAFAGRLLAQAPSFGPATEVLIRLPDRLDTALERR